MMPETKEKTGRGGSVSRFTWLTPACEVWQKHMGLGSFNFGAAAKHLKPLFEHYPPEQLAAHLDRYLTETDPRYLSLARFAQTFMRWAPAVSADLVDEFGQPTEAGRRAAGGE